MPTPRPAPHPTPHDRRWRNNQVITALWRYALTAPEWGGDPQPGITAPPRTFVSRIKKLKNLDRMPSLAPSLPMPDDQWAFYDEPGEGAGSEERFSTFHAFMLGIGLDLLEVGLKQAEIIFVLKHTRPQIQDIFDQLLSVEGTLAPIHDMARQRGLHKHYPESRPVHLKEKAPPEADFTVWMLIQRFEHTNAAGGAPASGNAQGARLHATRVLSRPGSA